MRRTTITEVAALSTCCFALTGRRVEGLPRRTTGRDAGPIATGARGADGAARATIIIIATQVDAGPVAVGLADWTAARSTGACRATWAGVATGATITVIATQIGTFAAAAALPGRATVAACPTIRGGGQVCAGSTTASLSRGTAMSARATVARITAQVDAGTAAVGGTTWTTNSAAAY